MSALLSQPSHALAGVLGIAEPPVRLLLALAMALPSAAAMRRMALASWSPCAQAPVILALGLLSATYFCRSTVLYPLFSALVTYALCAAASAGVFARRTAASAAFVFNFLFLMWAYAAFATNTYDISWTTCQSVLCLRLIGFAMDYADARTTTSAGSAETAKEKSACCLPATPDLHDSATSSPAKTAPAAAGPVDEPARPAPAQETTRPRARAAVPVAWNGDLSISALPSIVSFLAYAFFPGAFLVGPQFSFRLFSDYISHKLVIPTNAEHCSKQVFATSTRYAWRSVTLGILYIAASQVAGIFFDPSIALTPWFLNATFFVRVIFGWCVGKTALLKYFGVWLISEAACAFSGISYNGVSDSGMHTWDGLANIRPWAFETATSLNTIVACFNVNTNHWAKLYLFKRLRFLNNKNLSAAGTLLFLAFWHGFHAGYYFSFSLEFFDMEAERRLKALCAPLVTRLSKSPFGNALVAVSCWLLTSFGLFYSTLGFSLLGGAAIATVFNSLYWYGHVAVFAIIATSVAVSSNSKKITKAVKTE